MGPSFLCIAEDFKGVSFLTTLHALGCRVFLLTERKNEYAAWPRDAIEQIFYSPEGSTRDAPHNRQSMVEGTAWLMREHGIDRIVALDDFDVEDAALLREEFRIPGMGQTTARYFRDKLAMRMRAAEYGIPVPRFSPLFREGPLREFCAQNLGPYVIKPRSEASAAGIKRAANPEEALAIFHALGDGAYRFLIERFAPGRVYHVDALVDDDAIRFVRGSAYTDPPLSIVQGGGLFQSRTLDPDSEEHARLVDLTERVMQCFGMRFSASHTEFIRGAGDELLFLETSSRVGGAYISNMLLRATGVDLWAEWAKLEYARLGDLPYAPPVDSGRFGAVTIRAVGVEEPSLGAYLSDVAVELIRKPYHAGVVFESDELERVREAQDRVAERMVADFG